MTRLVSIHGFARLAVTAVLLAAVAIPLSMAANNTGTGDIAGVPGDLADSLAFALTTTPLGLVKTAFLADGTQLSTNATLPRGTVVKFMIYVDNPTAFPVTDVSVQDVLDPTFAYQTGSIKVDNTLVSTVVCPGGVCDEPAIFSQIDTSGTALGDGDSVNAPIDADAGSYTAASRTVNIGDSANTDNAQLDIAADRVWAVLITVTMQ